MQLPLLGFDGAGFGLAGVCIAASWLLNASPRSFALPLIAEAVEEDIVEDVIFVAGVFIANPP